jgi:hypothetical protein
MLMNNPESVRYAQHSEDYEHALRSLQPAPFSQTLSTASRLYTISRPASAANVQVALHLDEHVLTGAHEAVTSISTGTFKAHPCNPNARQSIARAPLPKA